MIYKMEAGNLAGLVTQAAACQVSINFDCRRGVKMQHAVFLSPVNEATFSFQARLVHEHYALFKVLSPVEHKKWLL